MQAPPRDLSEPEVGDRVLAAPEFDGIVHVQRACDRREAEHALALPHNQLAVIAALDIHRLPVVGILVLPDELNAGGRFSECGLDLFHKA